jgi:hypothetical protein
MKIITYETIILLLVIGYVGLQRAETTLHINVYFDFHVIPRLCLKIKCYIMSFTERRGGGKKCSRKESLG